jgi:hypothetical protein
LGYYGSDIGMFEMGDKDWPNLATLSFQRGFVSGARRFAALNDTRQHSTLLLPAISLLG